MISAQLNRGTIINAKINARALDRIISGAQGCYFTLIGFVGLHLSREHSLPSGWSWTRPLCSDGDAL